MLGLNWPLGYNSAKICENISKFGVVCCFVACYLLLYCFVYLSVCCCTLSILYMCYSWFVLNTFETICCIVCVVIVFGALASEWNTFVNNFQRLGPAVIALLIIMFSLGYNSSRWFKISPKMAITVAIESGIQNATVGITIGSLRLRQEGGLSVFSLPSGVYGIVMYFVCLPFVYWFIKNR